MAARSRSTGVWPPGRRLQSAIASVQKMDLVGPHAAGGVLGIGIDQNDMAQRRTGLEGIGDQRQAVGGGDEDPHVAIGQDDRRLELGAAAD